MPFLNLMNFSEALNSFYFPQISQIFADFLFLRRPLGIQLHIFNCISFFKMCIKMPKNVFDLYPTKSPEGKNQIEYILKYCLQLPLGFGVKYRQYFKLCFLFPADFRRFPLSQTAFRNLALKNLVFHPLKILNCLSTSCLLKLHLSK